MRDWHHQELPLGQETGITRSYPWDERLASLVDSLELSDWHAGERLLG